jgi:hypothetical protein
LLRLIGDHSNTSPDVSFQIPMMRGGDGSGFQCGGSEVRIITAARSLCGVLNQSHTRSIN